MSRKVEIHTLHPKSAQRAAKRSLLMLPGLIAIAFALRSSSQGGTVVVKDPGVRTGASGAGQPLAGLTAGELDFFNNHGLPTFSEVENVAAGLGPRFNLNSCSSCHAYPAVGGSSPSVNPQVTQISSFAPTNTVPYFLSINGPIREARFLKNPDGTADGGVHSMFTITGRPDSPAACAIHQPDYSNAANISFRIPTPVFGMGLIESISDAVLRSSLAADANGAKARHGTKGRLSINANDGTVNRFGWKAQNKSLTVFAGEAYSVEMGVTNEVFPNEREDDPNCISKPTPESDSAFAIGSTGPSDVAAFRGLMRFLAAPTPACTGTACSSSIQNGHALAEQIGCLSCHTETLVTGKSATAALSQVPAHLFSDLAIHHMGPGLQDGISQGTASVDEFRTAPLWGLGQRVFFLHDGRTTDLVQAIEAHGSAGSEGYNVTGNYERLMPAQRQDVLNFLRSL